MPDQLEHDLVLIVPAGVAIAIATALIWWLRSRAAGGKDVTPAPRRPPREGGNNDVP